LPQFTSGEYAPPQASPGPFAVQKVRVAGVEAYWNRKYAQHEGIVEHEQRVAALLHVINALQVAARGSPSQSKTARTSETEDLEAAKCSSEAGTILQVAQSIRPCVACDSVTFLVATTETVVPLHVLFGRRRA
jgi:hypothetical protein